MKKLYHATMVVDVLFASEDSTNLRSKAKECLLIEGTGGGPHKIDVIEVPNPAHIPKDWVGCFIYGVDENVTAEEFFNEQEEYQEYLRLKTKYE